MKIVGVDTVEPGPSRISKNVRILEIGICPYNFKVKSISCGIVGSIVFWKVIQFGRLMRHWRQN
jgi:hypothetical protein